MHIDDGTEAEVTRAVFRDCIAASGGNGQGAGIRLNGNGLDAEVTIKDAVFEDLYSGTLNVINPNNAMTITTCSHHCATTAAALTNPHHPLRWVYPGTQGGGISSTQSNAKVINATFRSCTADLQGGGIDADANSILTVEKTSFDKCESRECHLEASS